MDVSEEAVARTVWGEMRSLGERGMHAVANVVMNRVAKQSWYGKTPSEVCFKNSHNVYQFDCNDPVDPNYEKCLNVTEDDPQFVIASRIAADACAGVLPDITDGALNYYSTTVPLPSWAVGKTPCLIIGNTNFYNNIN